MSGDDDDADNIVSLEEARRDERRRRRAANREAVGEAVASGRFEMRPEGLVQHIQDKRPWVISGPFEVLAETRDDEAQAWGLMLKFADRDGAEQRVPVPRDLFAGDGGELRALLARRGLYVNPAHGVRGALSEYLATVAVKQRARLVGRTGWHVVDGERVFVLPDRLFGTPSVDVIYAPAAADLHLFNAGGTLDDWREQVARPCEGNSRLVLALCTAFAAPLLDLLGEEGGGVHFRGPSRVGKTTALRVAASVWGGSGASGAGAYIRQWRATANGVEGVAAAHSDALLALDELGQADPRELGAVAYMLANGSGKSRSDRSGGLRLPRTFRCLFLSTGEVALADKIAEANGVLRAGQEVRFLDITADAGRGLGIFDHVAEFASADALVDHLRRGTAVHYGTAAPAFLWHVLEKLRKNPDYPADLRRWADTLVGQWIDAVPGAGGQVRSVARRFALLAIAGELASEAEVTGWAATEAEGAAEGCFRAWVADRGTTGAREDLQAEVQLRDFIQRHYARFDRWNEPKPGDAGTPSGSAGEPQSEYIRTRDRVGWRRWRTSADGTVCWEYYMLRAGLDEALAGLDHKAAVAHLVARGVIKPDAASKKKSNSRSVRVPGEGQVRVYVISGAAFHDLGTED